MSIVTTHQLPQEFARLNHDMLNESLANNSIKLPENLRILFGTGSLAKQSSYSIAGYLCPRVELLNSIEDELWLRKNGYPANSSIPSDFTSPSNTFTSPVWEIGTSKIRDWDEARDELDVTVTLYIPRDIPSAEKVREMCEYIKQYIGISNLDTLVIRWQLLTDNQVPNDSTALDSFIGLWRELEQCVLVEKKVKNLGVSGFPTAVLKSFLPQTKVVPKLVQIGTNVCDVPKDYKELAQKWGFEIHVKKDVSDILPKSDLQKLVDEYEVISKDMRVTLEPEWVAQYTVVAKSRVVLIDKGYLVMSKTSI